MTAPAADPPALPPADDAAAPALPLAEIPPIPPAEKNVPPELPPVDAPLPLAPPIEGPFPGEPPALLPAALDDSIPLAAPRPVEKDPDAPVRKPLAKPQLATTPMWPAPEEAKGRAWLATVLLLVVLGLYSYMLSCFYSGAHGGVDQAGYLMTARLLTGDRDVDTPLAPAKPAGPPTIAASTAPASSVWGGGAAGYTAAEGTHPAPKPIQISPTWNWLRNRLSFVPESPFQFASRMCIITEPYGPAGPDLPATAAHGATPPMPAEYRVYAKYPFGFSLLAAVGREIAAPFDHTKVQVVTKSATTAPAATGPAKSATPATQPATTVTRADAVGRGLDGMYIINPLCTVLACFFAYFMYRQAVTPFTALIGVLWLACNPMVLNYSNDANSHASTLFAVCVGFWGVISFLRTQQMWRAWIGGFALGYACTIRYSEALLVLPVFFAAAVYFRPTWRRAIGAFSLIAAWAIPICVLMLVCWVSFGSPFKTGYTYCNEDTGFGWSYLSGYWDGHHTAHGNWETLVLSVNRTGLFIMWPLAIAGLFGMLGSVWRLGGLLTLWIMPPMILYMMYYWAPNNENVTNYLRFFASIIPGMIFAGVWLLERGLANIKGEKWAGLTIGTAIGVVLLLVIAFRADGGPRVNDGGLGKTISVFAWQTPHALWHLVSGSKAGALWTLGIVGAVTCMWLFDRKVIASRMGIVLGAGVITALGCAINLYGIVPTVEAAHVRWTTLRVIVDNMRETLPRGSVVFCEDNLLNQLDCVGGWKLYNQSLFTLTAYSQNKARVDQRNDPERADDPDPIQTERSQFYVELLTQPSTTSSRIALGARTDFAQLEKAVIDRNVAEGHRITFLVLEDPGSMAGVGGAASRSAPPVVSGYVAKQLRKWTVSPEPTDVPDAGAVAAGAARGGAAPLPPPVGRAGRGARGRGAAGNAAGAGIVPLETTVTPIGLPQGATYVLWELVKTP